MLNGRSDRTIRPGGLETLTISFSSKAYAESFSKTVRVTTNDLDHLKEGLVCEGRILRPLQITPPRVDFGQIHHYDQPLTQTVTITRGDGGPIAPEILRHEFADMDAQLREIEPGERYELEVTLGPPWPKGEFKYPLRLKTGVAEVPEVRLPLTGGVTAMLTMVPPGFAFPPTLTAESTKTVSLRWDRLEPTKILTMETAFPGAALRVEDRGYSQRIFLTLPAGPKLGGHIPEVTVTTDNPEIPTFAIPITFGDSSISKRTSARGKSRRVKPRSGPWAKGKRLPSK